MHSTYLFLALDIARERSAEAARDRLAAEAGARPTIVGRARRLIARAAVAVRRAAERTPAEPPCRPEVRDVVHPREGPLSAGSTRDRITAR